MPSVKCLGFQQDIGRVYSQADIFALPSWEEGGALVTLEAMAHGLPSLVTPMGTSGAVTDKEGIIVEPGNVDQMADALVALSTNVELRHALGKAAGQKSRLYTWQEVARRRLAGLRAIYDSKFGGQAQRSV
jgi:glycosyltransferase involved in cell wall biosynthesis